jgi:hypothetical protein
MPSEHPANPAAHDERGWFVVIAASSYVAYSIHGTAAHLARLTRDPDGTITVHPVGEPFARLDLAVDAGRWRAEREAYAATAEYACAHCGTPVTQVNGEWVGIDYTTTGGGRSACPPDPDSAAAGVHVPRRQAAASRHDTTAGRPVTDETTDAQVRDWFAVYRTEPEAVWTIGALTDTDVPLRLGITTLGGGTVGRRYPNNGWIYGLWHGQRLHRCGADLRSGGIGHTHQEMAVLLAEHLTNDEDLDADIRARLATWLDAQPVTPDLP